MTWPDRSRPYALLNWVVVLSYLPAIGVASFTYLCLRPARRVGWRRLWRTPSTLPTLMLCSLACRLAFLFCMVHGDWWMTITLLNRVEVNLSFTVFALVASHWSRIATALTRNQSIERPRLLLAVILLAWAIVFVALVATQMGGMRWDSHSAHLLRTLPMSALFAIAAVLVLVQGLRVYRSFRRENKLLLRDPATDNSLELILRCAVGVSLTRIARFALFVASIVDKGTLYEQSWSAVLYPWFYYTVPETLQVVLICLTLLPRRSSSAPRPKVVLDRAGSLRDGGSSSRSVLSASSASLNPLEVQSSSATLGQSLLEEWAAGDELQSTDSMYSIPTLIDKE